MINNPNQNITIWLIHDSIEEKKLQNLICFCLSYGAKFEHICISKNYFEDAKITKRYPQSMYYKLLAPLILLETLDKVLYLDPDTLVINKLDSLWKTKLPEEKFYAAASPVIAGYLTDDINKFRFNTDHSYFNTGVILMDLIKARKVVDVDEIIKTVNESKDIELILPDQDIFNTMYGKYTLEIPEELYNYDARLYFAYLLNSSNQHDLN